MKVTYKIIEWQNDCFFNELAAFDNELDASIFFDSLLKDYWFLNPDGSNKWEIELQKTSFKENNLMMKIEVLRSQTLYEEVLFYDLTICAIAWNSQKQTLEYVN